MISCRHRVYHTVTHVVFEDHFARVVQGGAHSRQLYQHLGAIIALFHHTLDLFQMANGPGQAVDHRFLVFVNVVVAMGNAMGVEIGVVVAMIVVVVVRMIRHLLPSFSVFPKLYYNLQVYASPHGG